MDEALATNTALELPATLVGRAVAVWEAWQPTGRDAFFYKTELAAGEWVSGLVHLQRPRVALDR